MIYECPQCQKPQEAGQTVCSYCRAEFDGPVPDDAMVLLEADAVPAEPVTVEPVHAESVPIEEAAEGAAKVYPAPEAAAANTAAEIDPGPMPLDPPGRDISSETAEHVAAAASPPVTSSSSVSSPPPPPSGSQPYLTPPTYVPPPYTLPPAGTPYKPVPPSLGKLTRALLIAFPIVLILVLLGVYFAGSLNSDSSEAVPEPPVAARTETAPPPPAPVGNPLLLQGGTNTNDGSDYRVKLLAGRWVSKSDNFYVFNADGTGSRGSTTNPAGEQSFLWGLVQNRLMLYGSKNETLRFNTGPDNDTVFLGPQTGHYVQYSRAKS